MYVIYFYNCLWLFISCFDTDVTKTKAENAFLQDGRAYYSLLRATNLLGYVHVIRSDGIAVQIEPLIPGIVRDGDIIGYDLNYQPSTTELSANWDGFGEDYNNIRADGKKVLCFCSVLL